jgi:hypothetical protein
MPTLEIQGNSGQTVRKVFKRHEKSPGVPGLSVFFV